MIVLETFGTIRADGTLDLEQKLSPLPGRVKVRVESIEAESAEDLAKRFAQLVATWEQHTGHFSRMGKMAEHPAFRDIVAMGERAVPLILAELEKNGGFLFLALREIMGMDPPIPEGYRGNKPICEGWIGYDIEGMQAAWLVWGREKGYRWEHAA